MCSPPSLRQQHYMIATATSLALQKPPPHVHINYCLFLAVISADATYFSAPEPGSQPAMTSRESSLIFIATSAKPAASRSCSILAVPTAPPTQHA
mmetsp:Transcript_21490/g.54101  ORF Transcript_21490/g.54101 Transcript_21490/m.54101 type:complete len:95 (+) Transcript_21490:71-355(+)